MAMLTRLGLVWCLACSAVIHGSAQDPTKTLPEAYKVQFENDYARVVRVHYVAGAKLPEHTHPAGTTVYVYLNDSEGVVFAHSGNINRSVTRPAVKTGGVRIATGPDETHTAENPASTPSDFLRIVVKAGATGPRSVRRLSPTENEFANTQMRISRLTATPGNVTWIETPVGQPALVVELPSGNTRWFDASQRVPLSVLHNPAELVRIDFLTPTRPSFMPETAT